MFSRASRVTPAVCGLASTLSNCSSGCSGGGGSLDQTSRPAPAMRFSFSACNSASSSWMKPRAVVMKKACGCISANCFAPIMPRFSLVSGQLIET